MCFSYKSGMVTRIPYISDMAGAITVRNRVVVPDAVFVDILSRYQGCPRRHTEGRIRVAAAECDALLSEPVQVGRDDARVTIATKGVPAMLVGEDEDDIGFAFHGLSFFAFRLSIMFTLFNNLCHPTIF